MKETIDRTAPPYLKDLRKRPYDLVGHVPDWALRHFIGDRYIKIDPLPKNWEKLIRADSDVIRPEDGTDPVTIDFRLGPNIKHYTPDGLDTIDTRYTSKEEIEGMMRHVVLKVDQPFILTPEIFVLTAALESLTLPKDLIGHLYGKSSLARLGIVVHSTAPRFDPGWVGNPALEIGTHLKNKKVIIYHPDPICAFSFEKMMASVDVGYAEKKNRSFGGNAIPEASNISASGMEYRDLVKRG